jgi:hypothetical protein
MILHPALQRVNDCLKLLFLGSFLTRKGSSMILHPALQRVNDCLKLLFLG